MTGVVYFAAARDLGYIKLGRTRSAEARIKALQSWCPVPLTFDAQTPGAALVECWYLHRYRHLRLRGEWHHLAPLIEGDILTIRRFGRHPQQPTEPPAALTFPADLLRHYRVELFKLSPAAMAEQLLMEEADLRVLERRGRVALRLPLLAALLSVASERGLDLTIERVRADARLLNGARA